MATQRAQIEGPAQQNNANLQQEREIEVQAALSEVLQSTPFRTSKQARQLLQYIVQQTIKEHFDLLKERIIGAQVFGRRADYDTNDDPIVRTRAGEVRKRLAQYYLGEGSHSKLRIEVMPGSYHATFVDSPRPSLINSAHQSNEVAKIRVDAATDQTEIGRVKTGLFSLRPTMLTARTWIAGSITVLAAAVTVSVFLWPQKPIEVFWQPMLSTKKPVLIYSGANAVYMLSAEFMDKYKSTHQADTLEERGQEFVIPLSPETKLPASDLISFKNEFVTLGDLSANVRIAVLLTSHKKSFEVRSGEDVTFSDLQESPSLLVGAFNNRWTMELTGDLPFTFDRGLTIRDRDNKSRGWTPTYSRDREVTLDYAIVTRIPHSKNGQPLVTIAGITQSGTSAAANFVTSPQLLSDFLSSAPKDWASKNMQVLLQTKVVNNIPTTPVVIATRYW